MNQNIDGSAPRTTRRLAAIGLSVAGMGLLVQMNAAADETPVNDASHARCSALMATAIAHGTVVAAQVAPAGFAPSANTASLGVPGFVLPESCRVSVVLTPSPDSLIKSEVWLPTRTWNGRLQGTDNGGMGGSINTRAMMLALKYNYATASTDTGHEGRDTDASFALGHPQKLIDVSWRAIHETAMVAKLLIRAYYGRPVQFSYFAGGSNGGREGLIEAQRFPEDYDGIVAGAPASDPANNLSTGAWIEQRLRQNPAGFIPALKVPLIEAAVMKACDGLDGLVDGVVDDPRACHFDPAALSCPGAADDAGCLTVAQVRWLEDLYGGPGGSYKGHRNWGYERGGEGVWTPIWFGQTAEKILGPVFSIEFFRYVIYGDPTWDLNRFSFKEDRAAAVERVRAYGLQADDPDLSHFAARGGKLILYQGWADPLVPPRITIDYFDRVRAAIGPAATARSIRLFMAPGVGHVIGGPGPNVFGQLTPGGASDPEHSVTAAVERWVEHGIAPEALIAGKYVSDYKPLLEPGSMRPLRERPLCPYPQVARWTGAGSIDEAKNFVCLDGAP